MLSFAWEEAIARKDKASGRKGTTCEGDVDSGRRLPGDAVFAALADGLEHALRGLRPSAAEGCVAAENMAGVVVDGDPARYLPIATNRRS